eukprot:scaffold85861_cov27-Tisochrysis_lutea.AAC.1
MFQGLPVRSKDHFDVRLFTRHDWLCRVVEPPNLPPLWGLVFVMQTQSPPAWFYSRHTTMQPVSEGLEVLSRGLGMLAYAL